MCMQQTCSSLLVGCLISIFVVHCLVSKIVIVPVSEVLSMWLASVGVQAGLCFNCLQTPKTDFSYDKTTRKVFKEL